VSVIGAGTMGRGIAFACAIKNLSVVVQDIHEQGLTNTKQYMEEQFQKSIQKGKITEEQVKRIRGNIHYSLNIEEAVKQADLVIEAVLEIMDLKIEIFKELDKYAPKHAILATNTSTMSPTEIAAQTKRPDQCIALHFFNPVTKMKLIEVVCGLETSEETITRYFQLGESIRKKCVRSNECLGFAVSRMNCYSGNEAMNMVVEGVGTSEDIDKAMKLGLNHPMGPLELADLVGLDTRLR